MICGCVGVCACCRAANGLAHRDTSEEDLGLTYSEFLDCLVRAP